MFSEYSMNPKNLEKTNPRGKNKMKKTTARLSSDFIKNRRKIKFHKALCSQPETISLKPTRS